MQRPATAAPFATTHSEFGARLRLAALGVIVAAGGLLVPMAQAQDFPSRPVKILVGSAPGGGVDAFSRVIAQKLQEMWGQPVVVENKLGASASIAADFVAKSAPDGYTVVMGIPNSHTIGPHVLKLPYDALRDFTPITLVMEVPHVLVVSQNLPVKTMKELVEMAKANPGKLNYYSSGIGSTQHLAGEMFKLMAGIDVVHIPYKGSAPAIADVLGGTVTMGFDPTSATLGQIQGGKLKVLAVAAPKRTPALPSVPTTAEAGYPGMEMLTWYGLFGPPNLPRAIVDKWQRDVARVVAMPDVQERIAAAAAEPRASTPEEFTIFVRDQYAKMGKLVKDANVKAEE
jgi:tripartite-type tricarboxylate transporter receptor subunit TctC